MAPEQLEGHEADMRTDIFAFGAVLYEVVTGRKAFDGKSHASLIAAILEREPPAMSTLQPLTLPMVDHIVKKCLAKDPDERWQSAKDLHDELKWAAESGDAGTATAIVPARSRSRTLWVRGAAAAALVALGALGEVTLRRAAPEPLIARLDVVTPPTTDAFSFALSFDGRQLAFVATGERGLQLWLRPLDQVKAQPLIGTEGASYPFWAPDGRAIGFFADGKLKRIDLTGGTVQVLADAPQPRGGTWNADGVIVFAASVINPLMRVGANGGTARPVTKLTAGQGSHRWPQFLPDGRRFLFFVGQGQPETHGVYVGSLDGGEPARVLPSEVAGAYAAPGYLLVVSQGVLSAYPFDAARAAVAGEPVTVAPTVGYDDGTFHSAFSVSQAGILAHRAGGGSRRQLVWFDRTGKTTGFIGSPDENAISNPELAPDDQRVAVNRTGQGNIDVWLIDVGLGLSGRFTFDPSIDSAALWSPDGNRVVFRSTRKGTYDLFEKPVGGTTDVQPILVTSQGKSPLNWSRDGRLLLYSAQGSNTASDLWVVPLTGQQKPSPVLQTSFDEIEGQLSPDGTWLAYASNESGRYEVYIQTFPEPGGKWQVSVAGGAQPRWGRDGRELFYVASDSRLMAVPIRVARDARAPQTSAPVGLFSTRLASGGNIPLNGFQARAQYAVASDGRFLMNVAADDAATSPITVVLNWATALKK